jgi:hypothetical protein
MHWKIYSVEVGFSSIAVNIFVFSYCKVTEFDVVYHTTDQDYR